MVRFLVWFLACWEFGCLPFDLLSCCERAQAAWGVGWDGLDLSKDHWEKPCVQQSSSKHHWDHSESERWRSVKGWRVEKSFTGASLSSGFIRRGPRGSGAPPVCPPPFPAAGPGTSAHPRVIVARIGLGWGFPTAQLVCSIWVRPIGGIRLTIPSPWLPGCRYGALPFSVKRYRSTAGEVTRFGPVVR